MLGAEDNATVTKLQKVSKHVFRLDEAKGIAVAEDADKIIAVGALFPRMEAAILVDNVFDARTRAEAILALNEVAVEVAQVHGCRELLVLSPSPIYSNFLIKRAGFERLVGEPLILELP